MKVKIFMLGITGYIGGAVLERFLKRPDAVNFEITALVRSPEKAEKFKALGINVVVGSLSDLTLLEKLAAEADVTIAMADCDDLPAAEATLRGCRKRFEATGEPPIFINTSGTAVLKDDARGLVPSDIVYDDMNPEQIESLAPTQPHRPVDLVIVQADKEGYVKTYIILPPTIYGIATGKVFEDGLSNPHSIQIPALIKTSLARGQGAMFGTGENLWPNVEIHELADLYSVLYDSIVSDLATGHGREGFYFGANGEHKLYDVGKTISQVLVEIGRGKSPEPTPFTEEEIKTWYRGRYTTGSNSRCVSNRSYSIGWKPQKTTADLLESIKPEVDAWVAKGF